VSSRDILAIFSSRRRRDGPSPLGVLPYSCPLPSHLHKTLELLIHLISLTHPREVTLQVMRWFGEVDEGNELRRRKGGASDRLGRPALAQGCVRIFFCVTPSYLLTE